MPAPNLPFQEVDEFPTFAHILINLGCTIRDAHLTSVTHVTSIFKDVGFYSP